MFAVHYGMVAMACSNAVWTRNSLTNPQRDFRNSPEKASFRSWIRTSSLHWKLSDLSQLSQSESSGIHEQFKKKMYLFKFKSGRDSFLNRSYRIYKLPLAETADVRKHWIQGAQDGKGNFRRFFGEPIKFWNFKIALFDFELLKKDCFKVERVDAERGRPRGRKAEGGRTRGERETNTISCHWQLYFSASQ